MLVPLLVAILIPLTGATDVYLLRILGLPILGRTPIFIGSSIVEALALVRLLGRVSGTVITFGGAKETHHAVAQDDLYDCARPLLDGD